MSDIIYPDKYLPDPLIDGYGFKSENNLLRTEMVTGLARQRRKYKSVPNKVPIKWLFDDDQASFFMSWYRDILCDGSAWFMMKLKTPQGIGFFKCRFTAKYDGPTLIGGKYWQCSASMELREMPMMPDGWSGYPEWFFNRSLLDIAINRDWPKS